MINLQETAPEQSAVLSPAALKDIPATLTAASATLSDLESWETTFERRYHQLSKLRDVFINLC